MKQHLHENRQEHYFVNKIFTRMMLPSLIAAVCMSIGSIADAVVVGANAGEVGLAAISYSYPIYMLYNVIAIGLASGATIAYSKAMGEGDYETGKRIFGSSLTFLLVAGAVVAAIGLLLPDVILRLLGADPGDPVVFAAARQYAVVLLCGSVVLFLQIHFYQFLMNDDAPRLANLGMLVGNIADILLNLLLVLGAGMGAGGAAWATILGGLLSVIIFLPHFFGQKTVLRLRPCVISWEQILSAYRTGMAYTSQSINQMITITMMNHLLGGLYGTIGVALYEVLLNCRAVVVTMLESVGETLRVLISTFFVERGISNIKRTLQLCAAVSIVVVVITMSVGLFAPDVVCALFGLELEDATAVCIYAVSLPLFACNVIMTLYYQTVGQERLAYIITLLQSLVLFVPIALLCSWLAPQLIWWIYPAVELVTMLCWLPFVLRSKSLLMLPWQEDGRVLAVLVESTDESIGKAIEQAEEFCTEWDADPRKLYFVTMAIEEISLAIRANKPDVQQSYYIQLTVISEKDGNFTIHLRDNTDQFDPFSLGDKKSEATEPDMDSVGMQVIRNKALMFHYRHYQGFNTLILRI